MKYLRIFEEFDTWEKITADQWYSTFDIENQPFDETEYETLLDFCFDNANYEKGENEYEIDYDYINPNKMGYNGNMERAWRFTILILNSLECLFNNYFINEILHKLFYFNFIYYTVEIEQSTQNLFSLIHQFLSVFTA